MHRIPCLPGTVEIFSLSVFFLSPGSCHGACGLAVGTEAILARVVNNTEPASYLEALLPLGRCPPHHCLLDFEVEDLDFGPSCVAA